MYVCLKVLTTEQKVSPNRIETSKPKKELYILCIDQQTPQVKSDSDWAKNDMSAARLPYYQQQPEEEQQLQQQQQQQQQRNRRSVSRGRGTQRGVNGGYHERSNRRERSRSVERGRRYSRSRSVERQRRRHSRDRERRHQQHRHHNHNTRDSRDRSWEREKERERDRERDYSRRSSYYQRDSRSRSTTPPSRRQQQQQQSHGSKQSRGAGGGGGGGIMEDSMDEVRMPLPSANASGKCNDKAMSAVGAYYNLDTDEPFDKERIHREIEEKLRETLARDGKVYPPPKPEASHPVFANDGSFMELFKKMQEEQQRPQYQSPQMQQLQLDAATQQQLDNSASVNVFGALPAIAAGAASSPAAPYIAAAAAGKSAPPPPMVGRRRGGKILKTGVVAKLKTPNERDVDPKDFWSLYLAEVNKYKSNACDTDNGKRPLVK
ncbi:zinc finger CCCH domain-containing protein 13 [Drosophila grimshawi]|uniref:zinc finger CCCH domain-containing protein 13 n=1 Tax=Drosophila grimshawi TaxID=7222 RepID=UPI000C86EB73|nr:zinc finger CCCH domain-containing protein 13 [Drosophila grimshawi]